MTHIYLNDDKNGQKEIYCKGHSGYSQNGYDIVCSAISFLTYGFNRLVIELDKKNKIQLNELKILDGEIDTIITDPLNVTDNAFWMIRQSLFELEKNYPENVKIYTDWGDFVNKSMQ